MTKTFYQDLSTEDSRLSVFAPLRKKKTGLGILSDSDNVCVYKSYLFRICNQ